MIDVVLVQRIDPQLSVRAIVVVTPESSSDGTIAAPRLLRSFAGPALPREISSPRLFREDRAE